MTYFMRLKKSYDSKNNGTQIISFSEGVFVMSLGKEKSNKSLVS